MKEAWIKPCQTSGHSYSSAAGQVGIESANSLPGDQCCDVCWAGFPQSTALLTTPNNISGMWWRAPNNWELLEEPELLTDIPLLILGDSAGWEALVHPYGIFMWISLPPRFDFQWWSAICVMCGKVWYHCAPRETAAGSMTVFHFRLIE